MGILNVTPDSFWVPSRAEDVPAIRKRVKEMIDGGADMIDIGAVSTRPGAAEVPMEEEWARLEKALSALDGSVPGVRLSIDTTRSEIVGRAFSLVAGRAGEAAARTVIVNDISAGESDPYMLPAVAELGLTYVAMHKRGTPQTMDSLTDYPEGVVEAVMQYFREFSCWAEEVGVKDWILDPGFGFAKTDEQNLALLENLDAFKVFGRPVLVGIADKRFTGGRAGELHRLAVRKGADILRVHDVAAAVGLRNDKPAGACLQDIGR